MPSRCLPVSAVLLAAALLALAAPAPAAASESPAERMLAKYHWHIERSHIDGSASAFVLCKTPQLRFRVRVNGTRAAFLELFVNGRFISRVDRRGLIGLKEGEGLDPQEGSPWLEVTGASRVRTGMNRVTLVYRGRMGRGDPEAPGPGVWSGEAEFVHCRLIDALCILKGFSRGTGLEAEIYRALQALDGDLRSASRLETLDHLEQALRDAAGRVSEILLEPQTRRFYGEVDDLWYERTGRRMDLEGLWRERLDTLSRLLSFWARSRLIRSCGLVYRRTTGLHDRLESAALARENLRNLYWVFASRDYVHFGPDRFEAALNLGRQCLEVVGDVLEQVQSTRDGLRGVVDGWGRAKGKPAGSDDLAGPYGMLERGGLLEPHEYADTEKLAAIERELNLYLTLVQEFVLADAKLLRLELDFLARLIGVPPPEPARNRRPFHVRPKWEK